MGRRLGYEWVSTSEPKVYDVHPERDLPRQAPPTSATTAAQALLEFAEFLEQPVHPGLDQYTLVQAAMQARSRALELREVNR